MTAPLDTVSIETKPCMWCHKTSILTLEVAKLHRYICGEFVQDVWPEMDADQRELIMTGTHPACWNAMVPEDDD